VAKWRFEMQKNSISALTIINPEDEKPFLGLADRDYKMIAIGAAVGIGGIAAIMHLKKALAGQAAAPQTIAPEQVTLTTPGPSGMLILGALGAAGWYVWSNYKASKEPRDEPSRNPKHEHSSGTRYFVRVSGTNEVYPKPGSKDHPHGYSLRSAQDFARIGSQSGAPRKVLRGSPHGTVVRKYVDGKRAWPKTIEQARSLRPVERPSKLRESA